ncbi:MAG: hypothetical protein IPM25_01325 [Chloracidobacterium sp.]|nr:hypothetical protein [Chloracidobacterium sp.]
MLELNETRFRELTIRRSTLYDRKDDLLKQIGDLVSQTIGAGPEEKERLEKEIEVRRELEKSLDEQIKNTDAELDKVKPSGSFATPSPVPEPSPLTIGDAGWKVLAEKIKEVDRLNPRLTASVKLDNYVQFQYELLAKQLTLLRDDVGPDERVIFLELPTSIDTIPGAGNERTAQSLWRIRGYCRRNQYGMELASLEQRRNALEVEHGAAIAGVSAAERILLRRSYDRELSEINREVSKTRAEFFEEKTEAASRGMQTFENPEDKWASFTPEDSSARTIDLIPRQSSLNITDVKEVVKDRGFKAVFSLLIGIGGSVNYQRRREQFEQFQQQEVYAAGFGKGESNFGWTFSPMPGTKRLAPGIRTTYAVVIVPRDAAKIALEARTRNFRSNREPPAFNNPHHILAPVGGPDPPNPCISSMEQTLYNGKLYDVSIPTGNDEGFWVSRVDYNPVGPAQKSVVILRGNFSSQTGVLVNGNTLSRTIGITNPWFENASVIKVPEGREGSKKGEGTGNDNGSSSVNGHFELINANYMILVFTTPPDLKRTPDITLVSPGRARSINDLTLMVNGRRQKLREAENGCLVCLNESRPSPSPSP